MPAQRINQVLASKMREIRRRHGLTQERTAALIGCDYKYYQAIEAGGKDLKLSMLERLARPFGLRGEQLLWEVLPETSISGQLPPDRGSAPHRG